jgi:ABC-type sugar transport system substrate-binding protein
MAVLALVAIFIVAGCGGGGSSSSSDTSAEAPAGENTTSEESGASNPALENASYLSEGETGGGLRPEGGAEQKKAEEAGKKAGEEKEPAKLPNIHVGIINFLNGIESSDRNADSAVYAAAQLGWESTVCDGKGTASQWVACGNALLAEGVGAIIALGFEAGQIAPVIAKAKAKGIPVVQCSGEVPLSSYNGSYAPNEKKVGEVLTTALMEKLNTVEEEPVEVVVHSFPASWGVERVKPFEEAVAGQSKVKIADTTMTDAANLVPFTRNAVTTQLTQNPNVKAFWFTFDSAGQVGGQVVESKFPGKEFPEKPLVATFHGDLATLTLMEQGAIDMESDVNYDASNWVAVDGIAQELARHEPMSKEPQPKFPTIGEGYTYQIVTKENLPESGQLVQPEWDVPSYFTAKWKAEYGA